MKPFEFNHRTKIIFGENEANRVGEIVAKYGSKCLIVSDPIFDAIRVNFDAVTRSLREHKIEVVHFDKVAANPNTTIVEQGRSLAKDSNIDVILAFGGGSSIDTAKIISASINIENFNWDDFFEEFNGPFKHFKAGVLNNLPLITIPTTSGTGSHITHAGVITDVRNHQKRTLFHPDFVSEVSIIDPKLMHTLPSKMSAITGFDAFAHAFESFTGKRCSKFVELLALESMKLVIQHLPSIVKNGSDNEGRENLALADTLSGMSLSNGGGGAPHKLGELLTREDPKIPHGLTLALIYPAFTAIQYKHNFKRYAQVAELFGAMGTEEEKAKSLHKYISTFITEIGLDTGIKSFHFDDESLERTINLITTDLPNTSKEEQIQIIRNTYINS